ncbi:hypothetical protein BJX63DRAFT_170780 [Aspergillus granulosus]|uniref:Uncharacterized protein n=1 Tax=Aspergillus granulosus TaxID=176169 RepID=A0ABR4HIC1_9EURO
MMKCCVSQRSIRTPLSDHSSRTAAEIRSATTRHWLSDSYGQLSNSSGTRVGHQAWMMRLECLTTQRFYFNGYTAHVYSVSAYPVVLHGPS